MHVVCPKCFIEYDLSDDLSGKRVECECGHKFTASAYNIIKVISAVDFAGADHYQSEIKKFQKQKDLSILAELEPANLYDSNAIVIKNAATGGKIGYVSRYHTAAVAALDGEVLKLSAALYDLSFTSGSIELTIHYDSINKKKIDKKNFSRTKIDDIIIIANEIINHSKTAYWEMASPEISDEEYDLIVAFVNFFSPPASRTKYNANVYINQILKSALVEYSAKENNTSDIPDNEIVFPAITDISADNKFNNAAICFTGFYPDEKEKLQPIIEKLNIQKKTSVSRKVQYLITGANAGPAKITACQAAGIPIIPISEFLSTITS